MDWSAPVGEYKVVFTPREVDELKGSNSSKIPKIARDKSTTTVMATVKDGDNVIDLEIPKGLAR